MQLRSFLKSVEAAVMPRPVSAVGTFLRICTVNDVYKIEAYPALAALIGRLKASADALDCVVISTLNGDFLSPCVLSSLDGGKAMGGVLDRVPIDYCCLGNHEFDVGGRRLAQRIQAMETTVVLNSNVSGVPELEAIEKSRLRAVEALQVGRRRVCLSGFATDDLDIYRPGTNPKIRSPIAAATELCKELGDADALIPLTHQAMSEDRIMAARLAGTDMPRIPVILGGHDHELYVEEVDGVLVVKVGQDAEKCGIVDVFWDSAGTMRVSCSVMPLNGEAEAELREAAMVGRTPRNEKCRIYVDAQLDILDAMLHTEVLRLPSGYEWSSERVRHQPSRLVSFLLAKLKRGLGSAIDVVALQGGAVRANKRYQPGPFTWGDLVRELAFDTEMAIIRLPGRVIADSVLASRQNTPEVETPAFLHLDAEWTLGADSRLYRLQRHSSSRQDDLGWWRFQDGYPVADNGVSMDPDATYSVAIYQFLLQGMNQIKPLLAHIEDNPEFETPEIETCFPAKNAILETSVCDAWRNILDRHAGNFRSAFDALDSDKSGAIDRTELAAYVESLDTPDSDVQHHVPLALVSMMFNALDSDQDKKISYAEFLKLAL